MRSPLTVYKASAGSGKTFTLAVEYIKLLVTNPYSYRTILAVTFTNKATEEMKMRILSQLYGIWKMLPDSKPYTEKICKELNVTEEYASAQSGTALHLLLHHYNEFRIETIDSFFQSVLRNLARELDLTQNLRIELNDKQAEEAAVDNLIEKLDTKNEVLGWIIKFINNNIEEDKSWNVIKQIKDFGQNIFKEFYKRESKQLKTMLDTKGRIEQYEKKIDTYSEDARKQLTEFADVFFDILEQNDLTIYDLAYGTSGPSAPFIKIRRGELQYDIFSTRFIAANENPEKWTTKKHPRYKEIRQIAEEQLMPLQQKLLQNYHILYNRYASAQLTTRLITQLRLLNRIEQNLREMNEEANRFLLSDTQQLLHSLTEDSDSPFIFEKIGTRLEHIMIDEFQDTSTIQWQNFRTLLLECMSHEDTGNLIVGDVKQSIYRWRSGDWRLLNNIEEQFDDRNTVKIMPLEVNYRSEQNIIKFNNAFFTTATDILVKEIKDEYPGYAAELAQAYSDVVQQIPPHRKQAYGLVRVKLIDKDIEEGYDNATMAEIADIINMLAQHGIKQSDTAILVRQNKHIPVIANYFLDKHKNINIVSDEAFQLRSSVAVNIIINAMRVVADSLDEISMANLVKMYNMNMRGTEWSNNGEMLLKTADKPAMLPDTFISGMENLRTLPLHELAESICKMFSLYTMSRQSAYISTFYDHLTRFATENTNDINKFLNEWDERLCTKTIKSNDIEGVRILSIHASKGLEYDNVIIPFCDWQLEIGGDTLWCKPEEAPYNELPLVPVSSHARQVKGTIYEKDYMHEHLQTIVDNLNLLYVAFTRASANMFIIGQKGQKGNYRSRLIEDCLTKMAENIQPVTTDIMPSAESSADNFAFGELYVAEKKESHITHNVLLQQSKPLPIDITGHSNIADFKQSNAGKRFIEGTDEEDDEDSKKNYIKTGSVLHEIFSTIHTTADIDKTLARMQTDGVLYDDDITNAKLTEMLRKRFSDRRIASWFSDKWTLFNECTILKWDDREQKVKERRPDRVMTDGQQTIVVDFKFGRQKEEHKEQVREYMTLLARMGCPGIQGYIWYVYSNKIVSIHNL